VQLLEGKRCSLASDVELLLAKARQIDESILATEDVQIDTKHGMILVVFQNCLAQCSVGVNVWLAKSSLSTQSFKSRKGVLLEDVAAHRSHDEVAGLFMGLLCHKTWYAKEVYQRLAELGQVHLSFVVIIRMRAIEAEANVEPSQSGAFEVRFEVLDGLCAKCAIYSANEDRGVRDVLHVTGRSVMAVRVKVAAKIGNSGRWFRHC
jgi:hypothetical protein